MLLLRVNRNLNIWRLLMFTGLLAVKAALGADGAADLRTFSVGWTLVTNDDASITASEKAVFRRGDEAYRRVILLKAVPVETAGKLHKADVGEIKEFIRHYRPPPIPYTSEKAAEMTGHEKFDCLEFAEDLVARAHAGGMEAQVTGILFKGTTTGHACAGFPTMDGRMLYFDSTPGPSQVSRHAHEAHVEVGQPYRRADGGLLAGGEGNLPVSGIFNASVGIKLASSFLNDPSSLRLRQEIKLVVVTEKHAQAEGIDYAGTDTLKVSDAQLARWNQAAAQWQTARANRLEGEQRAAEAEAGKMAALALAENRRLAEHGDACGQLRMGERYLAGDGVGKDLIKGRQYLELAAEKGSRTAADDLTRLDNGSEP